MNRSEQIDKALKDILKDVDCAKANKQCDIDYFLSSIEKCAKAALALPRRNCDVGNDEEQNRRSDDFCAEHAVDAYERCGECPLKDASSCTIAWCQMPYNESEAAE